MDYALIAALIMLCLFSLTAAAAAGYLIYEALTKMGKMQVMRSQLTSILAKNIIEQAKQESVRDHQNGQIRED
ncbi:MAG: hypothetical protein HXM53_07710 [Megasphaera micronuciformis]|nr:hypothetical protein [Megasphaera micronuciformis]